MKLQNPSAVIKTAIATCFVLFSLHDYSSAFNLKASQTQLAFEPDESFSLKCSHSLEEAYIATELVYVREMRLVKRVGTRGWETMAQIWLKDQEIEAKYGIDAIGYAENVTKSYLHAIWYHTLPSILGVYRCDIVGINGNNDLVMEKTNLVTVFEKNATTKDMLLSSQEQLQNLHLEFNKYKSDTDEQLRSLRNAVDEVKDNVGYQSNRTKSMSSFISELGQQLRKEMKENFKALQANHTVNATCACPVSKTAGSSSGKVGGSTISQGSGSTQGTIKTKKPTTVVTTPTTTTTTTTITTPIPTTTIDPVALVDDERRNESWPDQTFGLPMAESGCPAAPGGATWSNGFIAYHTESGDENRNNVSYPNHLNGPVMRGDDAGNNFMHMYFCVKDSYLRIPSAIVNATGNQSENATGPIHWPAGSYCINRAGGSCPRGFDSGYLDIDEEDTGHIRKMQAPLPDMLFFCCRKDGPANSAVRLPVTKPFFMYRFGGQCQAVMGMQVQEESLTLDTEDEDNSDGYENEFHPDGHVEDVHIELCYYSQ